MFHGGPGKLPMGRSNMNTPNLDRTVFYLGGCSTCREIMQAYRLVEKGFRLREIKTEPISPRELDVMKGFAGSFEALFSRRAIKYREMGLDAEVLGESDYRRLLLQEYSFLKRPVVISGGRIFVGSGKPTREALADHLGA